MHTYRILYFTHGGPSQPDKIDEKTGYLFEDIEAYTAADAITQFDVSRKAEPWFSRMYKIQSLPENEKL